SLITGEPRSATIIASVATHMLELDSAAFRDLIARFPRLLENLVGILAGRLGEASSRRGTRREASALLAAHPAPIAAAAQAASVKPVAALPGDVDALHQLDRLLGVHAPVILTATLDDAPLLLEHVDRAVAVDPDRPLGDTVEVFVGKDVAWLGRHLTRTK